MSAKARTVWRCQNCGSAVFALDRPLHRLRRVRHLCRRTGAARGRRPAGCSCVCRSRSLGGGHRRRGVAAPHRHRRARPRAWRRTRRWLARAARRRAGHRQVDAAAPGRGGHRRPVAPTCCTYAARSRHSRWGCAPSASGAVGPRLAACRRSTSPRSRPRFVSASPACSSWTRSRPRSTPSSPEHRAASVRSARVLRD